MPENQQGKQNERGKEQQELQDQMAPKGPSPEQFSDEGTYMEPNAAQIPWKNVPYDPADSRPNPDSEIEGQAEELTGKKPTKDRFGNPIEEVPAPRGEPQNVAAGIAYNPPTAEELAEKDKAQRGQPAAHTGQGQGQGQNQHPQGGPPGQTGQHPQGGPPGQQAQPEQQAGDNGEKRRKELEERHRKEREEHDKKK